MDIRLIKANVALFNGAPGEARRLVQAFLRDHPATSQALWLDAQTSPRREERLERLKTLLASAPPDDPYARFARQALDDEARYTPPPRRRWTLFDVEAWKIALFLMVGALLGVLTVGPLAALFSGAPGAANPNAPTPTTASPAVFSARVTPLPAGSAVVSYPQGVLQVTAREDYSTRVATLDGRELTPVPGARFYALEVIFECRQGICGTPPQAQVSVRLDDGVVLPARDGVGLLGGRVLQPIAQGRATTGWLVFELPETARVVGLELLPPDTDVPLFVPLP